MFIYYTTNRQDYDKLMEVVSMKCPNSLVLFEKNVSDGIIVLLPIFYIFFLVNFNLGSVIS